MIIGVREKEDTVVIKKANGDKPCRRKLNSGRTVLLLDDEQTSRLHDGIREHNPNLASLMEDPDWKLAQELFDANLVMPMDEVKTYMGGKWK